MAASYLYKDIADRALPSTQSREPFETLLKIIEAWAPETWSSVGPELDRLVAVQLEAASAQTETAHIETDRNAWQACALLSQQLFAKGKSTELYRFRIELNTLVFDPLAKQNPEHGLRDLKTLLDVAVVLKYWSQFLMATAASGKLDLERMIWLDRKVSLFFYLDMAAHNATALDKAPDNENPKQRLIQNLKRLLMRDFHQHLKLSLAEALDDDFIFIDSNSKRILLRCYLKLFGFPNFSTEPLLDPDEQLQARPKVLFNSLSDDSLAQMEGIYEAGGMPVLVLDPSWTDDCLYDTGVHTWVRRAIVRGPTAYHYKVFEAPCLVHFGTAAFGDTPKPGSDFLQMLSSRKDVAQRILAANNITVPDALYLEAQQPNENNTLINQLFRTPLPLDTLSGPDFEANAFLARLRSHFGEAADIVIKPNQTDMGVGVKIGRLDDPVFTRDLLAQARLITLMGEAALVQARIFPPLLRIDGIQHDWNLRIFVSLDAADQAVVSGIVVRHGPSGGPINLSISAGKLLLTDVVHYLNLSADEASTLEAAITDIALKTYACMQAAASTLRGGSVEPLSLMGVDLIVQHRADQWLPHVIEVNAWSSGAQSDLGELKHDLTIAVRDQARFICRQAQAFKDRIARAAGSELNETLWSAVEDPRPYFAAMLAYDPNNKFALDSYGDLALRKNNLSVAENCFGRLVHEHPNQGPFWAYYALTLSLQAKLSEATLAYTQADRILGQEQRLLLQSRILKTLADTYPLAYRQALLAVLDHNPKQAETLAEYAGLLFRDGHTGPASVFYLRALAAEPVNHNHLANAVWCLLRLRNYAEIDDLLARHPARNPQSAGLAASLELARGQFSKARQLLNAEPWQDAPPLQPLHGVLALIDGNYAAVGRLAAGPSDLRGIAFWMKVLWTANILSTDSISKHLPALIDYAQGKCWHDTEYRFWISLLHECHFKQPYQAQSLVFTWTARLLQDRPADYLHWFKSLVDRGAVALCRAAIDHFALRFKSSPELWLMRGKYHKLRGHWARAAAAFSKLKPSEKYHAEAVEGLSEAYWKLDNYQSLVDLWQPIAAASPFTQRAALRLAMLHHQLKHYEAAEYYYRLWSGFDKRSGALSFAMLLWDVSKYDAALAVLQQGLHADSSLSYLNFSGVKHFLVKDYVGAEQLWLRALQIDPCDPHICANLAELYAAWQKPAELEKIISDFVNANSEQLAKLLDFICALEHNDLKAEALAVYQTQRPLIQSRYDISDKSLQVAIKNLRQKVRLKKDPALAKLLRDDFK